MKKTAAHPKNRGAPPKTLKNSPNGTKTALFPAFLVEHHGFLSKLQFSSETPRPIAELQSYVGIFKNSSVGPRYGAVSVVIWGKTGPKLGYKIPKKGAKI